MSGRSCGPRSGDTSTSLGPLLLVGLWLLVARSILGYVGGDPRWNDVICGAILVLCAVVGDRLAFRLRWPDLVSALVGAWLVVASLGTDISTSARLSDGITGVVVFMIALARLSASDAAPRPPVGGHPHR